MLLIVYYTPDACSSLAWCMHCERLVRLHLERQPLLRVAGDVCCP
jgi:hypothetical protein